MRIARACVATLILAAPGAAARAADEFTDRFDLEACTLSDAGENRYFSLEPGHRIVLEGEEDGETVRVEITVSGARQRIAFTGLDGERRNVRARVVEEREFVDDEIVEVSRNFFARCAETNDIYYFGEDVDIYEDGHVVSHDGAWRAGVDGAQPGLIMPGTFLLGSRYFQEVAPDVALDRAEHVAMGLTVQVPAGTFEECVEIEETSPLDAGASSVKIYCPEVGLVDDNGARLVEADDAEARPVRPRHGGPR
jgi:hypothetical protein